ncbi:MAG: pyruvate, phosphate dikinase, partial [Armatimonadia bacterium]|nr:pyruvate, phosphate dikinase [Armatimonadia bacterium]
MAEKRVWLFREGNRDMRDLLGGKGANLAEMTRAGLPVPYGFTVSTATCWEYVKAGHKFPRGLLSEVKKALADVEKKSKKKFGDAKNPLLVSVRSGAKFSMPGMMDTVLNLGLNDEVVEGLAELTDNPRFAYDCYRRFIMMFSDVVKGTGKDEYEEALDDIKERIGVQFDYDVPAEELKELVETSKKIYKKHLKEDFPQDPMEQLEASIGAVFDSWDTPRARTYRNSEGIPHDLGTAVNVQMMVFGNTGEDSGTGVAFTRDPSTGEKKIFAEFLPNAQGEDVVAGVRTPLDITDMAKRWPEIYKEFVGICEQLEKHYREMQDMEFTVERGKLWVLQTRNGKRTAGSAVKIAVDMVKERLISREEALWRVAPGTLDQLLHKRIDRDEAKKQGVEPVATGLNASPGAATGIAAFDADTAAEKGEAGESVILCRIETTPDDIHGMLAAKAVLTSRGGKTSHAAVVARGKGLPCVAGCEALKMDLPAKKFTAPDGQVVKEGDWITVDGSSGEVYVGQAPLVDPEIGKDFQTFLSWADKIRKLGVRTNADEPEDAAKAIEMGAEGIGLCRTEHMFMAPGRLPVVQEMILADDDETTDKALTKLLPMQREDFVGIFEAMNGKPVTIRLLDPPLHEFLPDKEEVLEELVTLRTKGEKKSRQEELEALLQRIEQLEESNPMLGLRGCRLGLTRPGINAMQVRAIIEAACELKKKGKKVKPEIMIPLVGIVTELSTVQTQLEEVAKEVMKEQGTKVAYQFGTMIEIPRAALTSAQIAEYAQFFSFGTNDLTQMTFGYSRDDAEGKFIGKYLDMEILPESPFTSIDEDGVGRLVEFSVNEGRQARPKLKCGICGEHGGDPQSIDFCHRVGLDYVSCSPFRVPIARLSAAHAAIKEDGGPEPPASVKKAAAKKKTKKKTSKKKTGKKTGKKAASRTKS